MKKRVTRKILSALIFILIIGLAFAANDTSINSQLNSDKSSSSSSATTTQTTTFSTAAENEAIQKAYKCLDDISDKAVSSLSLQEATFATIAQGNKKNLTDRIEQDKNPTDWCWPKSACNVKETAQTAWAYKRAGKGTENILKWLSARNGTSNDLIWYLEIDITNHGVAECTLKYDSGERKINILEDMKIYGNPGSCFSTSSSGYWLVFRENCFDKDIQVSCNQDFVTAKLYQKKTGGTIFVVPDTHSAVGLGSTSEKVDVKCFKNGNRCDYEGSLWAALVLQKEGKNIDVYLPYLVALADDNEKYFPSAFLYALTGSDDNYNKIIQSQKQGRSWKMIGTPYNEFYDTGLALMALTKNVPSETSNVKNYLLSIQTKEGCWNNNNIRDTAIILFAGWPKSSGTGSGTTGSGTPMCTSVVGQSCEISTDCLNAGGSVLNNFECAGLTSCCSKSVEKPSCSIQKGIICEDNQRCDGRSAESSDSGVCCLDRCIEAQQSFTCEDELNRFCKDSCDADSEDESSDGTCSAGQVCCQLREEGGSSLWIIILIILILLIALAIIFRKKLILAWYKFRGNAKSSPIVKPAVPPSALETRQPAQYRTALSPRYSPPATRMAPATRPVARQPSSKDKEFEDTLKKLKDMSK